MFLARHKSARSPQKTSRQTRGRGAAGGGRGEGGGDFSSTSPWQSPKSSGPSVRAHVSKHVLPSQDNSTHQSPLWSCTHRASSNAGWNTKTPQDITAQVLSGWGNSYLRRVYTWYSTTIFHGWSKISSVTEENLRTVQNHGLNLFRGIDHFCVVFWVR